MFRINTRRRALVASVLTAAAFMSFAAYWWQGNGWPNADERASEQAQSAFDNKQARDATRRGETAGIPRVAGATTAFAKSGDIETQIYGAHMQDRPRDPSKRLPNQPSANKYVDSGFDAQSVLNNALNRPSMVGRQMLEMKIKSSRLLGKSAEASKMAALAACDPNSFGSLSGSALVNAVKSAELSCINTLFDLNGKPGAFNTFRESQMITISNAFRTSALSYDGTNSGSIAQLILFLRAGYFVHFYDTSVGTYGPALKSAIQPALDAFASNKNFSLVNDVHGETLAEFVTLIDSSDENARFLYVAKDLLNRYDSSFNPFYWMRISVNNSYTITFRGHQKDDFRALALSDPSIIDTLYNFADRNWALLGTDNDYLTTNAARELTRFIQYTGATKTLAATRAKALVDRSSITGTTAKVWVGVGEMVTYYDPANCAYYNQCDLPARIIAVALPVKHSCSSTLTIRAQAMTAEQLTSSCSIVAGQETYFHRQFATGKIPVASDNNAALEMVVFNSSSDYETYAGAVFGIDTNNGGIYLEGDPAVVGNQARFIAYRAEWMPVFEIWNLTHEYVHYLDGRFNMFSGFSTYISQRTEWWIEGMAEYLSYSYRNLTNTKAIDEAALGTYSLSTIYQNDYNASQKRIYTWGYLASRFMFEKRNTQVNSILGFFRPGNYAGYVTFMSGIGKSNDSTFSAWLPCVVNASTAGCGGVPNVLPVAGFNAAVNGLTVTFTDTSTDSDGTIASRSWNFGDGTTSTAANPSKAYAAAGTYTVSLVVTDSAGGANTISKSVVVSSVSPPSSSLSNGVGKAGLAAAMGADLIYTMDVPAGATNLKFVLAGGTGDADMYVRFGSAPTLTTYDCRPFLTGNNENCPVATTQAGRYYVMLHGYRAFSGASLIGSYTATTAPTLPQCTETDIRAFGKNCSRSNRSVTAGNYDYMFVLIPAGTTQLTITVSGGTGNADLYFNPAIWATNTVFTYSSKNVGNSETITVPNPPKGYVYMSLHGVASGMTVSTQY
jgi:microbial collagenase